MDFVAFYFRGPKKK